VHLLCQALRLAPSCYRQFELLPEAGHPLEHGGLIEISGCVKFIDSESGDQTRRHGLHDAVFGSVTDLASAMQQYAADEHLSMQLSPDMDSIVVRNTGE